MSTSSSSAASWKAVYTVLERKERSLWIRIGTAFVNRDGSLNVKLDALPINGALHIRDAEPKDAEPADAGPQPVPHVSAAHLRA